MGSSLGNHAERQVGRDNGIALLVMKLQRGESNCKVGFLNCVSLGILECIILYCGELSCALQMFNNALGPYPLDTNSPSFSLWYVKNKMSQHCQMSYGGTKSPPLKITPIQEPMLWAIAVIKFFTEEMRLEMGFKAFGYMRCRSDKRDSEVCLMCVQRSKQLRKNKR